MLCSIEIKNKTSHKSIMQLVKIHDDEICEFEYLEQKIGEL